MASRKIGAKRVPEIRVRFRAPVAITDAQRMYVFEGRAPDSALERCRRVFFWTPTDRNIERGEVVRLFGVDPAGLQGHAARAGGAGRHHLWQQRQAHARHRRPGHASDRLAGSQQRRREAGGAAVALQAEVRAVVDVDLDAAASSALRTAGTPSTITTTPGLTARMLQPIAA